MWLLCARLNAYKSINLNFYWCFSSSSSQDTVNTNTHTETQKHTTSRCLRDTWNVLFSTQLSSASTIIIFACPDSLQNHFCSIFQFFGQFIHASFEYHFNFCFLLSTFLFRFFFSPDNLESANDGCYSPAYKFPSSVIIPKVSTIFPDINTNWQLAKTYIQ